MGERSARPIVLERDAGEGAAVGPGLLVHGAECLLLTCWRACPAGRLRLNKGRIADRQGIRSRVWFPYRYKCIEIRIGRAFQSIVQCAEPSATQVALGTMWDDGSWQSLGSVKLQRGRRGRNAGGARRLDDGFTHGLYWPRWSRFACRGI